jgi:hypothetical protein
MDKEEFEKEISICFQLPYHYLKNYGNALYGVLKSRENEGDLTKGQNEKNHPKVIVKTTAKSIRGKLKAIINQHLVCNCPESGDITLLTRDVVKYILNNFNVEFKKDKNNEYER